MEFSGFDWDAANQVKCQKHGVSIAEIESLFRTVVSIAPDPRHSRNEERFKGIGSTETGRKVIHAEASRRGNLVRPVSALHASKGGQIV